MRKVYLEKKESQFFANRRNIWYARYVLFVSMELAKFESLIDELIKKKISDLHITTDGYPYIRIHDGSLKPIVAFGKLTIEDLEHIIGFVYPKPFWPEVKTIDSAYTYGEGRFRINISRVLHGWSISFRTIPDEIPTPQSIELSQWLLDLTKKQKWIILVTGPTGSGKSTTLATMIEYINQTSARHIITLEDPIEFTYENKQSLIHQREYGKHFDTFLGGIRSVLREDPDVIVVWEMRDIQTIEAAITLAETWHLVLSTLHTNDTVQSIDRIIQSFPSQSQGQIRIQLGLSMIGIISQSLMPKKDGTGQVAAREILINNDSIRNLIIRWETQHMYSMIEISKKDGMILMDDAIIEIFKKWIIEKSDALRYMRDKDRSELLGK